MCFFVLNKALTKSRIIYWKRRKQKDYEEEGCNHYCFYTAVLGDVIWAELWGTAYTVCVYIVLTAVIVCWRGSDLSSLPKYYIAELILKLRTHKQASLSTEPWYVPECPANNNSVSHTGVCGEMKEKTAAQEVKMKFACAGGWGSQSASCSEAF